MLANCKLIHKFYHNNTKVVTLTKNDFKGFCLFLTLFEYFKESMRRKKEIFEACM